MAGLIPQSFIDDLLHRTDIVEVIDKRVALKKSGRNYSACCPFHQEKTPSFSVNQERQFYYCFGCGVGGNAIGFVMAHDHLDFPQAVETLARDAGLDVPREESPAQARKQAEHTRLLQVLEQASKYFQYQLRRHEGRDAAVGYLKSRGVSGEIALQFCLGFAPPGWDNLLGAIGQDPAQQQALLKAGLVIAREQDRGKAAEGEAAAEANGSGAGPARYYDRFRNRIMFPIRDSRGRTVAFGGRVLGDDKPKYLNSPETPVFQKSSELYGLFEARKSGARFSRLLLVEGYMDVIALAQMGIHNAVATLGTATSARHLTRMFRLVPEVVFCFDGDEAGRAAAWRALETALPLLEDGRAVKFLFLPEGSDPDSHVREVGKDAFIEELDQAVPLETFFFDKLSAGLEVNTIEGRARLSNLAKPLIRKLPHGVYAQLMHDRLAEILGVSSQSLDQLLEGEPKQAEAAPPPFADAPPPRHGSLNRPGPSRQLTAYHRPASIKAIELLLRNPEVALSITQDLEPLRRSADESRGLLLALIEMVQKDPNIEVFTLLGYCYGTSLGGQLTQLMKAEKITPQEGIEEEFLHLIDNILSDIRKKLEILQLKNELKTRVSATKDQT